MIMGYISKLIIPRLRDTDFKLYIYRAKSANDINTITKVSQLTPIMVIDQNNAATYEFNSKQCFVIYDDPAGGASGVTYNGPQTNTIPATEYETDVNLININEYTTVNQLILSPLPLEHTEGIVYYYSVIGVKESTNEITHLSKINAILLDYINPNDMTRQVWSCDDLDKDEWKYIATIPYSKTDDKNIYIGDINRQYDIKQLGLPMVEEVPTIRNVHVSLRSLFSNTFMVLEVENPWCNNNQYYNFRRLKSYKIRNVYQNSYGEFSTPTYQSLLPVSIEKMTILMKKNPDDKDKVIKIDDESAEKFEVIRRDGIFYNPIEHKKLGYNHWNVPLENNKLSVFSESSVQNDIKIQISATAGNVYVFDIYLTDVYKHVSKNAHYVIET